MESHLQSLVTYLSAHPNFALGAIFAAAFLEALAVIGTVIPGSTVVFVGGVLIGLKVLDPWWVGGLAIAGAILGDGVSYWLGHHYHEKIRTMWPMKNYPDLFERGHAYFTRNGRKSVFVARFLGPVRAIVPVVAGMANMPPTQFYVMNILSAFAWAAAHLLPGVLFGASLQLAGAVSSRLAIMLVATVAFFWIAARGVRYSLSYGWPRIQALRDRAVAHARRQSGLFPRVVLSLFDPARAESPALLTAAILLIGSGWLFLGVLQDVIANDPLVRVDTSVYYLLQGLRTRWVDVAMVTITELGGATVMGAVILVVAVVFILKRRWRTLAYWLAAVGFAEILVQLLKFTLGRQRPVALYSGNELFSFPSGHATMSIVVYGFLAFLLARGKPPNTRALITLITAVVITLIAFSRLYLGAHWLSDVLAGLSMGLGWVALLGIAYTHHVRNEALPAALLSLAVLVTGAGVGAAYVSGHQRMDLARYVYPPQFETLSLADWRQQSWRSLPIARSELGGDIEEPFSVQWAAPAEQIAATLGAAGWQSPASWNLKTIFGWILPGSTLQQLPVLPKFHQGAPQKLSFVKNLDAQTRMVIRLWPMRYRVASQGPPAQPLWSGMVTRERLRAVQGGITLAETSTDFITPVQTLSQTLHVRHALEQRGRLGTEVLLIW